LHQCQNEPDQFRARKAAAIGWLRQIDTPQGSARSLRLRENLRIRHGHAKSPPHQGPLTWIPCRVDSALLASRAALQRGEINRFDMSENLFA